MLSNYVVGSDIAEAYHAALVRLFTNGKFVNASDWNTTRLETSMTIEICHTSQAVDPFSISRFTVCSPWSLAEYEDEIVNGSRDFEVLAGKWPYTYHDRIADQLDGVIAELRRNPESTRAAIVVRRPDDIHLSDPPCLQHIQFTIREGYLNMHALFRSNDAWNAFYMNAWGLIALQRSVAQELDIPTGKYIHTANSFHVYEKDFAAFENAVAQILGGGFYGFTSNIVINRIGLGYYFSYVYDEESCDDFVGALAAQYSQYMEEAGRSFEGYPKVVEVDSSKSLTLDYETSSWFLEEIERVRPAVRAWTEKRKMEVMYG